jgi:hypothetical protein
VLLRFIATAGVLAGLTAVACGGGNDQRGPLIEGDGGSPERRSAEEIAADNAVRAAPTPFVTDSSPVVVVEIPTTEPRPSRTVGTDPNPAARDDPDLGLEPDDFTIPLGDDYDPELNMYRYISGGFHSTELTVLALASAVENHDRSQVAVIIEGLRIMQPTTAQLSAIALTQLTGQDFGPGLQAWNEWMEWYGRNGADFPPPAGYIDWKVNLLGQIDPAFADFLMPWAFTGRVDPTEIVWGGVRKDGIPDLQNPPLLTPEEAEAVYILPDDRLFGVSINGEHRAYPLRVINAHEMANDVLGGEPIALAY